MPRGFLRALGLVKWAAAGANLELGEIDKVRGFAIQKAALEVAEGRHDAHFPVDVFQTGSGTSSNMNANEVIARLATQYAGGTAVHPNDHVNRSQSSNDVIPTAIHVGRGARARRATRARAEGARRDHRAQGGRRGRHGQDRAHAPHGRHAAHARARSSARGARRSRTASRGCNPRARGCTHWRSAARRSARASTRRRSSALARRRCCRGRPASTCTRAGTSSPRSPRRTRRSSCPASCARSRSA